MTFIQTTSVEYKTNAGTVGLFTVTETGASQSDLDTVISAGATNVHHVVSVDVSQLTSFVMYSSQALTVKTNSASLPAQTFLLLAGQGLTWNIARTDPNPLTVDIADLYFTNAGLLDATVNLRFLFT
jgi:hypothetical protein